MAVYVYNRETGRIQATQALVKIYGPIFRIGSNPTGSHVLGAWVHDGPTWREEASEDYMAAVHERDSDAEACYRLYGQGYNGYAWKTGFLKDSLGPIQVDGTICCRELGMIPAQEAYRAHAAGLECGIRINGPRETRA
jgi:hypothetical protein